MPRKGQTDRHCIKYEALDNSLQNIHTVLSVCELEQREVITQQVLALVWTVQGIRESIIEDSLSVLASPSTDAIMNISCEPTEHTLIPSQRPTIIVSLPSPEAATDTSLASPEAATDTSLPSPETATDTSLASPEAATDTSLPSPEAATDTSLPSPEAATDTSLPSPEAATDTSLPSPEAATDTSLPSPEALQLTQTPSPEAATATSLPSPEAATDTSLTSQAATDTSLPSSEAATDTSLPSPEAATDTSLTSEAAPDTSLPSSEAATDTSLPSSEAATDTSLPSPEAATDTSLTSQQAATDTSLLSPEVATRTSLPSPANRISSLCPSLDSDLEPSVSSPPSTSKGDHATLVNTAPLTPVSNHTASTSTPLTPTTGILPFFKLAGQKIASLNQRSSPCKNTCAYHAHRQKGFKFQLTHQNRTDNPTDNTAKQIPMNERVTLPPRQTTDEVTMQPSTPPPSVLTCKPFLCASSFTPNKAPVTEISQQTSVKRGVLKSSHNPETHQSQTLLTWKASFLKTHSPKPKMLKKVKPFQLTPDTRTDSWRKLPETEPAPVQKVIKSNEKTVPQVKDRDRLSNRSIEELSKTRSTSSLQPWRSSSKSKSLLQPFMTLPLSQSPPALCSLLLSRAVAHPGSCRDPEGIQERTRNANIFMMNESEEGEDSFGSEFWDLRTAMSESHNEDIVTYIGEGNTKPDVLPAKLNLPQSEHLVSHASPSFESAKGKLFYNENKNVPLKKRFNPNFSETSKHDSPYKSSVFHGKPGTPNEKQITPKQKSRANGELYTQKTKPIVHGKAYTPKTKPIVKGKPYTPKTKLRAHGKQQVTPHRRSLKERKSYIEETSRTSRARQPMQSASMEEELVQQLEEILTAFMAGRKQATTKMLPPDKQNQLRDEHAKQIVTSYYSLCLDDLSISL
ncbi:uncharacterized protein PB18E9.04c-like [Haliotis rubra]|uniref:uncharacterized protein PB18E9.04c-like n=1 Tax=Haliotis rubra TaxID=36100 RepID=UPI001EE522D8|nr:uncharacterized protein PB18E9.04c-like [Haliotis rubra]